MPDKSFAEDPEAVDEEAIPTAAARNAQKTLEQLRRFPDVRVYGLLLNPDPGHPVAQVVRERWTQIHHLSDERVMILATESPAEWSESLREYWASRLGADFEKTWQEWQRSPDAGTAFQYLGLFNPHLDQSQPPCLAIFTDPERPRAIIRPLPGWDANSLYHLLRGILGAVRQCAEESDESARLECLKRSLTSPGAIILPELNYVKDKALEYVKAQPTEVVTTTISFVLALASGGVLALSPAGVTILKAIKEALAPPKGGELPAA